MVKHIVMFKFRDSTPELCAEAQKIILSMVGKVPQLRGLRADIDLLHSDRSCDVCLQADVDDMEALQAYAQDPYHCDVVKTFLGAHSISSVTADYEY